MALKVWRQGDVAMIRLDIPLDSQPQFVGQHKKQKGGLIRRGEHGGKHQLKPGFAGEVLVAKDKTKFVRLDEDTDLIHGEHGTVHLPAGWYEVRVQREETFRGFRNVQD